MRKIERLIKHPYFVERKEDEKEKSDTYVFERGKVYQIIVTSQGVFWEMENDYTGEAHTKPEWFRELFYHAYQKQYEQRRIKQVVEGKKEEAGTIIFFQTLKHSNGKKNVEPKGHNKYQIKGKDAYREVVKALEKEQFQVKVREKDPFYDIEIL